MTESVGAVLRELTAGGVPWLAIVKAGRADLGGYGPDGTATVIDITDPGLPPITVNPFQPEPGYPVQAHCDRLAGLFEAAFGLADPVSAVIRTALRRAYAASGWDALTGTPPPGSAPPPPVPAFRLLRLAALAALDDLGYDQGTRAAVHAFMHARLEPLWTGPAGRFLEGGHPADVGRLLQANLVLSMDALADGQAMSFLAGLMLVRVAERLQVRPAPGRFAVVLASAGPRPGELAPPAAGPGSAEWFSGLLWDIRSRGAEVIAAAAARQVQPHLAEAAARRDQASLAEAVLAGRRSAACGDQCRRGRPCDGYELRAAERLAHGDRHVWLRLWARTLLLAFLVGRPVPRVPAQLRSDGQALSPRGRACALATILDDAVTARAPALRAYYDPRGLMSVAAAAAGRMLDPGPVPFHAAPFRAGQVWVIPQLRWLHEIERLNPLGQDTISPDDIAPPLDFGLAGLPDWPGIRIRDRLAALRRHPLAMESAGNRRSASVALLGEDGRAGLDADLATAAMGHSPQSRLRYAAQMMGVAGREPDPGWLEVVLSWPDRIIRSS